MALLIISFFVALVADLLLGCANALRCGFSEAAGAEGSADLLVWKWGDGPPYE